VGSGKYLLVVCGISGDLVVWVPMKGDRCLSDSEADERGCSCGCGLGTVLIVKVEVL